MSIFFKRSAALLLALSMLFAFLPYTMQTTAAAESAGTKSESATAQNVVQISGLSVSQLQEKYPDGKYWNHFVNSSEESADYLADNHIESFGSSVTSTECAHHSSWRDWAYEKYVHKYDCNYFDGGLQCCGFARRLGYEVYGKRVSGWETTVSISKVKPGDVVHFYGPDVNQNSGHWVFVTAVSGSTITVGECNVGGEKCKIRWGHTYDLSKQYSVTIFSAPYAMSSPSPAPSYSKDGRYPTPFKAYNLANANTPAYDSVNGTNIGSIYASDECTVEEVYTNGWCKLKCSWDGYSAERTVYTQLSTFLNTGYTPSKTIVSTQTTTYTRSNGATSYGYIGAGDTVTKVGSSGAYTQVIYPLTLGGYKCAWAILTPTPVSSYPVPFKCRTISTSSIDAYGSVGGARVGHIDPDDDCVITAVYENGWIQCACPWDGNTQKTVYVLKSVFINSSAAPYKTYAPKYAKTYLRTDMKYNIGWIDAGDEVTVVGTSGDKTQIIYPADVGKRCAWVYTTDLQKTYTVSYNANGGTGAPSAQKKNHDQSLVLSSSIPQRSGYKFLGWAESASASAAKYTAGGVYSENHDITLFAVWRANEYNVSYNANGGTGAPAPQTKTHGVDLTLSSTKPTRTGYVFMGWSTNSKADSVQYTAGAKYTSNASVTLYAVWKAETYTVKYDLNGGSGNIANGVKTYGVPMKITDTVPTRTGYAFLGWNESSGATSPTYTSGQDYLKNANVTLYAVWKANSYTISYNANGGTGAPAPQTKTHGVDLTLSNTRPTRGSYTFLGWATSASASTASYQPGGKFSTDATTTLYAVWRKNEASLEKIEIETLPRKTVYYIGESFDASGLSLKLIYNDGTNKVISSGFTTSGFDSVTAGKKTIVVTYDNKSVSFNVTVNEKAPENKAQIVVSNETGSQGQLVKVTVSLENNPGLISALMRVEYDTSLLTLESVEDAGRLGVPVHSDDYEAKPYTLCWVNDLATEDFTYNGVIVTLAFRIADDAPLCETAVKVSYDYDNFEIFNADDEAVLFSTVNGSVHITDKTLCGDVNGDGVVNPHDRMALTRYLSKVAGYTADQINIAAADVNGDGVVNPQDRMILTRYLSKWKGYDTLPYKK